MDKTRYLALGAVSFLALCAGPAFAQEQSGATDEGISRDIVEEREIVVTGSRFQEFLNLPEPTSLISAEDRNLTGIAGARDLVAVQPGFMFTGDYGISVRGVGRQTAQTLLGQENTVIQYVDGFINLVPSNIAESTLYGGNVTFSRGPSGTRYGRNSLAGAINVISRAPTEELTGQAVVGINRGIGYNAGVNIAGPLTDNLGFRVGVQEFNTPSISKNIGGGPDGAGSATNNLYIEFQLEWRIGGFHIRNRATTFTYDNQPSYPQMSRFNNGLDGNTSGVFGALSPNPQYGYTGPVPSDHNEISVNFTGYDRLRNNFQNITNADLDLGFATLYYVGGYQTYVATGAADLDLTPRTSYDAATVAPGWFAPGTQVPTDYRSNYHNDNYFLSQELRLEGNARDSIEWIFGLYYFKQAFDEQYWESVANAQPVLSAPIIGATGELAAPNPRNATYEQRNIYNIRSKAIFGNVAFNLTDTLKIDAGLRHTWDDKDALTNFRYVYFYPPFYAADVSPAVHGAFTKRSDRGLSGRASLGWEFMPQSQIYVAYARGYQSSAFTLGQGLPPNNIADSQFLDLFEGGGFVSFGDFRLDGSVFYQNLHNMQIPISARSIIEGPNGPELGIVYSRFDNAKSARIYGAEFQLGWRPNRESNIVLSYTYLHPTFRSFCPATVDPDICGAVDISEPAFGPDGVTPNPLYQTPQDLSGNEIPRTPRHKASLYGYYGIDLGGKGHLYPGGNIYYQSSFYTAPFTVERFHVPGRTVVGLTLTYRTADDRLDITGAITNLFAKRYTDSAVLSSFGSGNVAQLVTLGADRSWSLTARYRF